MCEAIRGKRVITFSGTPEMTKFPCKYDAVRNTICGKWKITISPGNMVESEKNRMFVIRTIWMGLENVETKDRWEGRSDLKIARKVSHLFASPEGRPGDV